jgi:hypothetical protein
MGDELENDNKPTETDGNQEKKEEKKKRKEKKRKEKGAYLYVDQDRCEGSWSYSSWPVVVVCAV